MPHATRPRKRSMRYAHLLDRGHLSQDAIEQANRAVAGWLNALPQQRHDRLNDAKAGARITLASSIVRTRDARRRTGGRASLCS
jgi:hypothetical protein